MDTTADHPLGAAITALADTDVDTLTDDDLDAELVDLLRVRHRLDAEIARRAAPWDRRAVWRSDGSRAPWARLARTAALSPATAKATLRRARAVGSMPVTVEAWTAAEIGTDHVDLLTTTAGSGRGELFERDEAVLVTHCEALTWGDTIKSTRYWRQHADTELGRDDTPPPAGGVRFTTGFDGCVVGDIELDPIGGATVVEALRCIERELYRRDKRDGIVRTKAERMAAALVEMAIRAHTAPTDGKRPEPLLVVLAGEETLDRICELATGTVIAPNLVVPHLTHSQIQTFVFDGADRVLSHSPQRSFRGALRRAIQVRDRHCQHPSGCDAPIVDCDIDHRHPHAAGGRTEEANGELQCECHNRHSDLHHRCPADIIAAARERRHQDDLIRARVDALIARRSAA